MKGFKHLTIFTFLAIVIFTFVSVNVSAETNAVKRGKYGEAPMLAEKVDAGELPPVDQRLPENPLVVTPFDEIGKYGGTMRHADVSQRMHLVWRVRDVGLFRYDFTASKPTVDLAESYKFSDDLKTLTIKLRKGHKWSDGHPFTVDDIMFMWEDVQNNDVLSPSGPGAFWEPGGERAVFKKIDETTLGVSFAVPYPVVLDRFGRSFFSADRMLFLPKHYLQKWHIKYNPDAEKVAKDEGFDTWQDAFNAHSTPPRYFDPERPTVGPWMPEKESTDRLLSVRNPYFHMVDSEGNQLPYIDRWELAHIGDKELMTLKASSGELDFSVYYLDLKDMAVFKENEAKGNYRTLLPKSLRTSDLGLFFNRTVKGEELEKLFNTKDFRVALSIALNRKKMNDVVFFGLGTPFPALPLPSASFFQKEWATKYMEYDPDQANQILDSLGLDKRDRDGFRVKSDGERLSLLIEIGVEEGAKEDLCEMVVADWKAVGVEGVCKVVDTTLFNERHIANELQIPTWHIGRTTLFGRANPMWFGFAEVAQQRWGGQWALWLLSNGTEGIEPPQEIKDLAELYVRFQQTLPDSPEFIELGSQYYGWFAEDLPIIGTVGLQPTPLVVTNRLKNVPTEEDGITWASDHNFFQPYWFEQFYIDE